MLKPPRHKVQFLTALCALFAAMLLVAPVWADEISRTRQHELLYLLKQDCGSCHGLTLQGGLGPALTPQALTDKPKAEMIAAILGGRPGTPMPPWSGQLTYQEAYWLVESLYRGVK